MIPIRDTIPRRRLAFCTWLLLAANVLVFAWELSLGPGLERELMVYSFLPGRFFGRDPHHLDAFSRFLPILTSMFLHGGWFHLAGNMLYLWIFGDNVEDAFGHLRYVIFYLLCGAVSAVGQAFAAPLSMTPMVGASGAIAGVLGAYFVLYPHARVITLVPIFVFFQMLEIPAFVFLLFWFLLQFLSGSLSLGFGRGMEGIAWWAHVGGFTTGLAVALVVRVFRAARSARRS